MWKHLFGIVFGLLFFIGGLALSPVTITSSCFILSNGVGEVNCFDFIEMESLLFLFVSLVGGVLMSFVLVDFLFPEYRLSWGGESSVVDGKNSSLKSVDSPSVKKEGNDDKDD